LAGGCGSGECAVDWVGVSRWTVNVVRFSSAPVG
jgi:hypothetical protein